MAFTNNEMLEIKANKQSIGLSYNPEDFTTHQLKINKGDTLYLFTDGYPDQFGGPKEKKFKHKQLNNLLFDISKLPLHKQSEMLKSAFLEWKVNLIK